MNVVLVWVRYCFDEFVFWFNNLLIIVWSFYNKVVSGMLREIFDLFMEVIRLFMLKCLMFKEFDFGENLFVFRNFIYVGMKVEGMATSIDVDFVWVGKLNIVFVVKMYIGVDINIVVKDFEIYMKLRIIFNLLVLFLSLFGGLIVFMIERFIVEFYCEFFSGLDVLYNVVDKWLEEFVVDLFGDMFI